MDRRQRWSLVAVIIGSGMVFLDSTVVTVALPRIGQDLPSARFGVLEGQSYVYNGYLLSLSALLILAGALADALGRRRLFALGLAGFGVTSVLCGLAPTMEWLIAARVLNGAAGAALVPGSLAIITNTLHGEERGRAFGVWASASAVTTILGPLVGGLLVDTISWRAVFFLNVPLAAFGLWATARYVPESRGGASARRVDWLGSLVVATALGGLTFGAVRGQEQAWQDETAFVALGIGAVAAMLFVPLMARSPHPLVPLSLFRSRNFAVTNASTVAIYGGLYITSYFLVVFLQGTLGYNATAAGTATVPTVLFLALFSTRFGQLAERHGPRRYMAAGPALMALGTLGLTRVTADGDAWLLDVTDPGTWLPPQSFLTELLPGLLLFGLGLMVVVAPLTSALMASVPESRSGLASAVNNALSRVGPQLAMALLFITVTATFHAELSDRLAGVEATVSRGDLTPLAEPDPDLPPAAAEAARRASTEAFRLAMVVSAGLIGAGALINAVGIRNPPRSDSAQPVSGHLPGSTQG